MCGYSQAGPTATPRPATCGGPNESYRAVLVRCHAAKYFCYCERVHTVYILIHLLIVYCVVLVPHTFVVYLCILLVLFVAKVEC